MAFLSLPRLRSALASVLGTAGVVLAAAGCGGITPLGPDPMQLPPPRHLGSPIIVRVMRVQAPTATGGCPAGWTAAQAGGGPRIGVASARPVPVASNGASASATPSPPPPPPPAPATPCYRPAGTPITITTAAVSSVFTSQPPPGQAGPDLYGFIVGVPGADVAAVSAVIRRAYDTRSAVGISVAGKLWQAPIVRQPFPGQRLEISLLSRNQALQLHRTLVSSG